MKQKKILKPVFKQMLPLLATDREVSECRQRSLDVIVKTNKAALSSYEQVHGHLVTTQIMSHSGLYTLNVIGHSTNS